ncbi:MAG: HDOD domain-containing protein, partial [Rhodoferax sp.]
MSTEVLTEELKQRLPSPKGVALAIMEACRREDVTIAEVANLVQADPALLGRLLQQANSASMGGRPVVAVSEAVSRLGLAAVRQLSLSFSLIDQYGKGNCAGFDYVGFWSHSLLMGLAMKDFGSLQRLGQADELFTCGLLARVGCLALATAYPYDYAQLLLSGASESGFLAVERKTLQLDHLQMSAALLAHWGIPAAFAEPMLFQEDPAGSNYAVDTRAWNFVQTLHLSLRLADFLLAPALAHLQLVPQLNRLAAQLGISSTDLGLHVDQLTQQWHAWGQKLQLQTSVLLPFDKMVQATLRPDQQIDQQWLRILVVDDDRILRGLLERWLRDECQHTVMTAADGREALALALSFKPHVVLTDWLMPVMDGLELCQTLRASDWGQNIYVLMLTSVESENELVSAFDAGVDDYLVKPVNMRALNARLKAAWRFVRLREAWERDHE